MQSYFKYFFLAVYVDVCNRSHILLFFSTFVWLLGSLHARLNLDF